MLARLLRSSLMHRLVRFVCCALVATQLLSGAQFVDSGLERAQYYAGICLSVDAQCTMSGQHISLGESPSHALNLAIHLSGLLPLQIVFAPDQSRAPQVAKVKLLPQWLFASRIDHPPKA
jgi:hypothetical protein